MLERLAEQKALLTKEVGELNASISFYTKTLEDINSSLTELLEDLDVTKKANAVLSGLVSTRIVSVKDKIEKIINEGLSIIFDDAITIEINESVKRSKTEFSMNIKSGTFEGGQESFGGGVLSVIAFLLKVVTNLLARKAKLLVFDESLTFVSKEYQERLSVFIRKLCEDLDYTIVLISHQPLLSSMAHTRYLTVKEKGETKYKLIKESGTDE
jgi:DNA repair ATPase RecN